MNFELRTLQYGKYKGMDIKDIFELDPKYCKWLFLQPNTQIYFNIYNFLKSKFKNESTGEIFLEFGKYKNKSLSEIILKKDIKYLFCLRDMPVVKYKYTDLYKVLTEMLNDIQINPDNYY